MNLNKCVAFITGGAQGLGRAMSERLLKEGAKVAVADVNTQLGEQFQNDMEKVYGQNRFKFLKCDVSNSQELSKTFHHVKSQFGGLDIVCNNAGIIAINPNEARKVIDINLTAVMEGTFKAIELMSKQNGGNGGLVVNIGSAAGLHLMKGDAMYSATKTAVVAFSRSFKEMEYYEKEGIRVNCICPFFCDTQLLRDALEVYPPEKFKAYDTMGRAEKEDVVKALMHLVDNVDMNGDVIAVYPENHIFKVKFPNIKSESKL